MNKYISFHQHTAFSIKDGIAQPKDYAEKIREFGGTCMCLTEHGNMSSVFESYDTCKTNGLKFVAGIEAYFVDDKNKKDKESKDSMSHVLLLAKNYEGYKALLRAQYMSCKFGFYYKPRIDWQDLDTMRGNIILTGACSNGIVTKPFVNKNMDMVKFRVEKLKDMFGFDFYFEYVALERVKYYGPIWQGMFDLSKKYDIKSIITTDCHYVKKSDWKIQEILHNVDRKTTFEDLKEKETTGKGKGWVMQDRDLYLKSYDEIVNIMKNVFDVKLVEEFLDNTNLIGSKIEKYDIYPQSYVYPKIELDEQKMKNKIKENLYKKCNINDSNVKEYQERIKYEWNIIKGMGFLEYFHIVSDIVSWAKQNEIMCGAARGSAAGSLISYLLDITEVDPLIGNLSFERFLNPERCLHPEMLVKTRYEDKKIKDIQIGEKILTLDGLYRKIKNKKINHTDKLLKIKYKDGYVNCTYEHKFMIFRNKKFVEVKAHEIKITDKIIKYVGK